MTESNVIPLDFRRRIHAAEGVGNVRVRRVFQTVTVWLDDKTPPRQCERVLWQFRSAGEPIVSVFEGWTGRDGHGRFVRAGSDEECCSIGGMLASRKHLASGTIKIIGRIVYAEPPVERSLMVEVEVFS